MKPILTICIPTYNRAQMTIDLVKRFPFDDRIELIIVDDGSTEESFYNLQKGLSTFSNVKLLRKENGGKLSAVHLGLKNAIGKYFMDLDSDDLITKEGKEAILRNLKELADKKNIVGVCGLCLDMETKKVIGDTFNINHNVMTYLEMRFDNEIKGDKKEVVKTEILKSINIKFFKGEKRVPTSTQWISLGKNKLIFVNEAFTLKSYLPDGISKNFLKSQLNSIYSSRENNKLAILAYNQSYKKKKWLYKNLVHYLRFSFHGVKPFIEKEVFYRFPFEIIIFILPTFFFKYLSDIYYKRQS